MKIKDLNGIIDDRIPLWIDCESEAMSDRYDNIREIPTELVGRTIEYITVDGNGEMTINVKGEYVFGDKETAKNTGKDLKRNMEEISAEREQELDILFRFQMGIERRT